MMPKHTGRVKNKERVKHTGRVAFSLAGAVAALVLAGCGSGQPDRAPETGAQDIVAPTDAPTTDNVIVAPDGTGPTAQGRRVDAKAYAGDYGTYYFQTATKKHFCMVDTTSASCTSFSFPKAPKVASSDGEGPKVKPDSISAATDRSGALWASGDPANALRGEVGSDGHVKNKVLPYGAVLKVGRTSCTTAEATGVSCESGTHGFRLSSSGYKVW